MNMRTHGVALAMVMALFGTGCASRTELKPQSWAIAVQTAETREAHERLAAHYDEIAQTMDADAAEERAMLQQYEANPHKYGKRLADMKSQAGAMIRDFERAAEESRRMAAYHRQMGKESP